MEKSVKKLNNYSESIPIGLSDCHNYGITFGCDEDCPTLIDGKCDIFSSVEDFIMKWGTPQKV